MSLPHIDPHLQERLTDSQIKFFQEYGYLVIRNAIGTKELEDLRKDTLRLIEEACPRIDEKGDLQPSRMYGDPDYWYNDEIPSNWYKSHGGTNNKKNSDTPNIPESQNNEIKRGVPFRIEYPIERSEVCQSLLAHSFILRCMEQLLGTKSFIPTWDSLVFKLEGERIPIKWHRDAAADSVGHSTPAIDVGFYLDAATQEMDNCLWVIPASHKWPDLMASYLLEHLSEDGFKRDGAVPVPVQPGDIILHNILVLHGSAPSASPLRRTVYFEYRSIPHELEWGPHKPTYIPLKQKVLETCIKKRSENPEYDQELCNSMYVYEPAPEFTQYKDIVIVTLKYPHPEYFR